MFSLLFVALAHAGLKVVATTQDLAAITQAVGGQNVSVDYVVRGDLDPHFIDAKPSYMVKMAAADLVVCVGLDLEVGWLPSLVSGSRNPRVQPGQPGYLDASAAIRAIDVPTGSIDRSRGDLHPLGNPHYWLDPENGRLVARLVETRLIQLDPLHAVDYQSNLASFESKLSSKQAEWASRLAPLNGAKLIAYHSTYNYFARRYGIVMVGYVEPKPGIPPTPQHTLELAAQAKAAGVTKILVEPFHSEDDVKAVATATGAGAVTVPTSVGAERGIADYFGLFDAIVKVLVG